MTTMHADGQYARMRISRCKESGVWQVDDGAGLKLPHSSYKQAWATAMEMARKERCLHGECLMPRLSGLKRGFGFCGPHLRLAARELGWPERYFWEVPDVPQAA